VSDFGFSTLVATDTQEILLPKTEPWSAPECHHRWTDFLAAKKADTYSFGMLCLWILFRDRFSDIAAEFPEQIRSQEDFHLFKVALEELKRKDKMNDFAKSLVRSESINEYQKENLCQLFSISLVNDVGKRNSSFTLLLQLLEENRYVRRSRISLKILETI
jgi:hypothetical protein